MRDFIEETNSRKLNFISLVSVANENDIKNHRLE